MTAFEEMDSSGMFSHLMDESADRMKHARSAAMELLEMAREHEDTAEKLRHLAATLILEAQEYAGEIGDLLAMEFPMQDYNPSTESEQDDSDSGKEDE